MSKGYIYIASNNVGGDNKVNYINEAIFSAKSLRKVDPHSNITLYTDIKIKENVFSNIKIINMSLRCKQDILSDSPYDKSIYIDTDTYINYPINDLFDLLDKFELLGVSDYARKRNFPNMPEYMKIPYGFSEINGGIIGFKKCENFKKMMLLWNKYYNKYKSFMVWDQPSFRIALWESDIKMYVLPIEYNRRGLHTKEKCIKLKKKGDNRFQKDHLVTRIYHYHGLDKITDKEREIKAQSF